MNGIQKIKKPLARRASKQDQKQKRFQGAEGEDYRKPIVKPVWKQPIKPF